MNYPQHKYAGHKAASKRLACLPDRTRGRVMASPHLIVTLHWRQSLTQAAVRTAWGQARVRKWAMLRHHTGRQFLCGSQERSGLVLFRGFQSIQKVKDFQNFKICKQCDTLSRFTQTAVTHYCINVSLTPITPPISLTIILNKLKSLTSMLLIISNYLFLSQGSASWFKHACIEHRH